MDQITGTKEIGEALAARSKSTSLGELAGRGRERVNVIRASDIAGMITETVHRVVEDAGSLSEQDRASLVEHCKHEFHKVSSARKEEALHLRALQTELSQVRTQLAQEHARTLELEESLEAAQQQPAGYDPEAAELMQQMMSDMAEMKASMTQHAKEVVPDTTDLGSIEGMDEALDKIASSLDQRLDQFGRKMGISSAVETHEIKLDSLFGDDEQLELESNIEDLQLKKNTGAGIAGNLERLKKLKGGEDGR